MVIVRRGKKWCLISKTTGRTLGCHPTREKALSQEKAVQISKARKAGHRIPMPRS